MLCKNAFNCAPKTLGARRITARTFSILQRPAPLSSARSHLRQFSSAQCLQEKLYTKDHEWIEMDTDKKIGTIGITNYAAKALGDVVFVELPELDQEVGAGDTIGAVESVKSASDILIPVSGKIVEANELLQETPGTINKGPEAEGWIAKVEVSDQSEFDTLGLMSDKAYKEFTED